ncbi:hypothetical protein [Candidatus Nitrosotalea okcheonensis]|uniref:Uncharacterized protein n=1 Tax=Candidatus Nitrosotalea okcheonensis TaxID=1903276 RepID=A0A2H1FD25_9ARCH|nr:hypothetical protein [Candidatus Nitrosotalea okcheonensis]MDE1831034.1 hypothetical protein [Nitrososphaerota archaeon]MDE1840649.1 hypothetical protein [Nitrososphaerota archaeon]SMH70647.1 protein of unknown function [Candidatus Nitrosotalea okcheonensis]
MMFQERAITRENFEKVLRVLDSDEGVRIDNESRYIFVNRTSNRYCIDISIDNKDEFIYKNSADEVMDFLKDHLNELSKIFAY